jgi:hypothetical protein
MAESVKGYDRQFPHTHGSAPIEDRRIGRVGTTVWAGEDQIITGGLSEAQGLAAEQARKAAGPPPR